MYYKLPVLVTVTEPSSPAAIQPFLKTIMLVEDVLPVPATCVGDGNWAILSRSYPALLEEANAPQSRLAKVKELLGCHVGLPFQTAHEWWNLVRNICPGTDTYLFILKRWKNCNFLLFSNSSSWEGHEKMIFKNCPYNFSSKIWTNLLTIA